MSSLPLANQVRQLYVVNSLATDATPSTLGQVRVLGEAGKFLYFQHFGQGGLTSSDKIDVNKIRYIKHTVADDMKSVLKTHTIQVTEVSAGQVYEVKVCVHDYIGQGAYDYLYRIGTYRAKKNDDAAAIAAGLAADLQTSLGLASGANAADIANYAEPFFTVTVSGDTITIKEVEQYWELGRFPVAHMWVEITLNGIVTDDEYETFEWATIAEGTPTVVNDCGKKLADLEYACMGNRGDIYRNVGWPRALVTKYMVNAATDYDVIDIHYFFRGTGNSVQQSEKEITLIVPAENTTVLAAIQALVGDALIPACEGHDKDSE